MDTPDVHQRTGVALADTLRWNSSAVVVGCFVYRGLLVFLMVEARTNGTTCRVPDLALGHKSNFIFLKSSDFRNINNYVNYGNKTITIQLRTLNEIPQRKFR
ncbi:hypothetical protein BOTNAR_0045g00230 [Botryotinia narcissicola]|uniref:Uncharacterized protein n=1 Tax=Botryotinia narcissicola TaxID=278944 RepID=A0A4Z1J0V8_9HELO|nr:hypothetical protein BOTNAR_0045g00230 [Botryotinia narcissicola]